MLDDDIDHLRDLVDDVCDGRRAHATAAIQLAQSLTVMRMILEGLDIDYCADDLLRGVELIAEAEREIKRAGIH